MHSIKKIFLFLILFIFHLQFKIKAQSLGLNNSSPDASSILDATATDRGILIPRMTSAQRKAIATPSNSLLVFDTDQNMFYYNSGTSASPIWIPIDAGWQGNQTTIKILPNDFTSNIVNLDKITGYNDAGISKGISTGSSSNDLYAFVSIPTGFKATHVKIYGNSTDLVTVYTSDITTGSWGSSLGSAGIGTEINITDVTSTSTNFLVIYINIDATSDILYGGYVTIAPN